MSTLLKQSDEPIDDETADAKADRYSQDYQQLSCANCFTPIAFSPSQEDAGKAKDKELEEVKQKFKATHAIKFANGMVSENIVLDQSKLIQ